MNESKLMQLIADYYLGEAQLLTTSVEKHLLKQTELYGNMIPAQIERWDAIKKDFLRNKAIGGDDADVDGKVVAQLVDLVDGAQQLGTAAQAASQTEKKERKRAVDLEGLAKTMEKLTTLVAKKETMVQIINQSGPGMDKVLSVLAETIEHSIFPLAHPMDKKLETDLGNYNMIKVIAGNLSELQLDVDIISKENKASATKLVALSRNPRPARARKKTP